MPFPSKVKMKNSNVVLEIPSFQQEDAGGYECVAENKMGKNTVQGRLSFHGMIISHIVLLYLVHVIIHFCHKNDYIQSFTMKSMQTM